jgi:ankyrin repeat protein
MKKIFPKSYLILFIVLILSAKYTMSQEGSDLITAVSYQDLDKIKNLLESGVDINYQEESAGATALIMSAMYNFGDIARYLIEKGADVSIRNKTGHTALMAAAGSSEEVFDLLVANGADMNVKLEDGTSAFMLSISGVMSDFVGFGNAKKLRDNGADVDEYFTSGPAEGYTCLMMAARNQRPDIVNFLVENGANVNARAANGNTPLSLAEEEKDQEMIALLKQLGAK